MTQLMCLQCKHGWYMGNVRGLVIGIIFVDHGGLPPMVNVTFI